MGKNKGQQDYYLSVYGSDLSLWPERALKELDVQTLQKSDAFLEEQILDQTIKSMVWPSPSADLKNRVLEGLINVEPTIEMPWLAQSILDISRKPSTLICIMIAILCIGFGGFNFTFSTKQEQYSQMVSKMWYLGPTYVLSGNMIGGHS